MGIRLSAIRMIRDESLGLTREAAFTITCIYELSYSREVYIYIYIYIYMCVCVCGGGGLDR